MSVKEKNHSNSYAKNLAYKFISFLPCGIINLIPEPRLPFIAPPLASTRKLTRKPSFVGCEVEFNGLNGGQLVEDGLSPGALLTGCLDGKEAELRADAIKREY